MNDKFHGPSRWSYVHMGWVAHFPPTLKFTWTKDTLRTITQQTNRYPCEVLRDGSQRLEEGWILIDAQEMKGFKAINLYMAVKTS